MPLVSPVLLRCWSFLLLAITLIVNPVSAFKDDDVIEATSLHTCMDNSKLTADHFKVAFTPINSTISYTVNITSEIQGYVQAYVDVYAYGFKIISEHIDPCSLDASGLCPVYPGSNYIASTTKISNNVVKDIPNIAFKFPDIDAFVVVKVVEDGKVVACIDADLSNRKTVNHVPVKWVTAVIAGIGLLVSAIVSTMGSTYTAAHIAANSVSLFTYFQSVVIVSMCAVQQMPPIASAWAQNIAWSVGLINITFMQKIFRWYVAATGGTPTQNIFSPTISVLVQKRDVIPNILTQNSRMLLHSLSRQVFGVLKRDDKYVSMPAKSTDTLLVLRGIERIAYQANIERTSVVLTAFTFFVLICVAVSICFILLYCLLSLCYKAKWVRKSRFAYFRTNCFTMLKGTLLRLLFIAFPSILLFSFWEFVQQDSAAVIVLAVFFLILSLGILGWSSAKVLLIGKQSVKQHRTPAYLLFSDTSVLNKYGFLYVPYKAFSYYFVIPVLVYVFVKVCFVAFAQSSGKTQGIALFLIELAYLVGISYYKPYMDKSTNIINIIIATVMTVNALLVMFFSQLFHTPRAVASVMGIVFFILNAVFSLILLLYILISCGIVLLSKNPDNRYKPAADDRAAFIRDPKSTTGDAAELTALGAAAREGHDTGFIGGSNDTETQSISSNYEDESKKGSGTGGTGTGSGSALGTGDGSLNSYENNNGVNPFSEKDALPNQPQQSQAPSTPNPNQYQQPITPNSQYQPHSPNLDNNQYPHQNLGTNDQFDFVNDLVPPTHPATAFDSPRSAGPGSRDSRDSYNLGLPSPSDAAIIGSGPGGKHASHTFSNSSLQSFLNSPQQGAGATDSTTALAGEDKKKSKWKFF